MLIALLLPLMALSTSLRPTLVNAADDTARLRAVHAVPDIGGPVDVYVGTAPFTVGQATVPNFDFFTVTPYLTVPVGATDIRIVAAGGNPNDADQAVISATVTLEAGQDYSAIASGTAAEDGVDLAPILLTDDNTAPPPGQGRIRVAHFSPNAPAVDIFVNGERSAITNLEYQNASSYVALPAGTYTFGVAPTDGDPIYTVEVTLEAGQVVTAWANGLLGAEAENDAVPATQAFKVTPSVDVSYYYLRGVHAFPDVAGTPVDVYVDDTRVATFDFFGTTDYLPLIAGRAYNVSIVPGGGDLGAALITGSLPDTLEAGMEYSLVAHRPAVQDGPSVTLLTDDNTAPPPGQGRIRVAHFSPNAPAVDIFVNGERSAITNLKYLGTSPYVTLPAGTYTFGVAPTGGDPIYTVEVTLEAGQVVTAWANGLLGGENDEVPEAQAFKVTPTIDRAYAVEAPGRIRVYLPIIIR